MQERRLEDVEVKLAYLERHLEELDAVVRGLAARIGQLTEELVRLREERAAEASASGGLVDDVPPHHDRL